MKIVLWATDKSTGEDVYLRRTIPAGDEQAQQEAVQRLMESELDYEFSGWDYDEVV